MRKYLASLLALALFAVQAAASNLLIDSYKFASLPTLTFLQCSSGVSLGGTTQATFNAQNVGTAGATRATIIGIMSDDNATNFGVNSVTVGGDAATEVVDEGGTGTTNAALYILSNPVGTSENVVVTMSEASNDDAAICLWAVYDLASLTAVSSASGNSSSSASFAINLSATTAGGVAVGVCSSENSSAQTVTWTGLTEEAEADAGVLNISAADTIPTNGSSLNITCDWTGTSNAAGVTAAFR